MQEVMIRGSISKAIKVTIYCCISTEGQERGGISLNGRGLSKNERRRFSELQRDS